MSDSIAPPSDGPAAHLLAQGKEWPVPEGRTVPMEVLVLGLCRTGSMCRYLLSLIGCHNAGGNVYYIFGYDICTRQVFRCCLLPSVFPCPDFGSASCQASMSVPMPFSLVSIVHLCPRPHPSPAFALLLLKTTSPASRTVPFPLFRLQEKHAADWACKSQR